MFLDDCAKEKQKVCNIFVHLFSVSACSCMSSRVSLVSLPIEALIDRSFYLNIQFKRFKYNIFVKSGSRVL